MQQHRVQGDERFTQTWIMCLDCCGQTGSYLSAKTAIEAWNKRHETEKLADEIEKVYEKICDKYCKYPVLWDEEKEGATLFDAVCIKCPLCDS